MLSTMKNQGKLPSFVLLAAVLSLAAATLSEQDDASPFAPSPETELEAPLFPQYLSVSPESEPPLADSPETEPGFSSPLYSPGIPPSPASEAGSPLGFPPLFSPSPAMEPPADSDTSIPPSSPSLPSTAPIVEDDNDDGPAYEPTPSYLPPAYDEPDGNRGEEPPESYSEGNDPSPGGSSSDRRSKGGNGAVYGFVAGICLVGLGGLVYLKKKEKNGARRNGYDQYFELSRRDGF
ncbi:hypothetical protein SAY87_027979 [Trapa incisa]|uniref:Uncharacterized protein n=1 Tax=Trapa incisa TaxID=236973 RepID=A0AAN7KZX4_9MYRT|nr:hypothetical protein SAY87_027979 [Trapa incisa]